MHQLLLTSNIDLHVQLFRRVAAALPGMDSTENKPPEDSILYLLIFLNCFYCSDKKKKICLVWIWHNLLAATLLAESMYDLQLDALACQDLALQVFLLSGKLTKKN